MIDASRDSAIGIVRTGDAKGYNRYNNQCYHDAQDAR